MPLSIARLAVPACIALLAACSDPSATPVTVEPGAASAPAAAPVAPPVFAVVYRCPDGTVFTTFPRGDSAQIDFANRSLQTAGNDTGSAECVGSDAKDVWDAARLRGVALRAVGERWLLEITPDRQLVFAWDAGAHRTAVATPAPAVDNGTQTTVYKAKTEAGELHVELQAGSCRDGNDTYTASARVSLAGTAYTGCARTL